MSTVTPAEHTAIGGLAGLIEVCVMQPTVAIKNCLQEGRPFPRSISAYYRGLFVRFMMSGAEFRTVSRRPNGPRLTSRHCFQINAGAMSPIIATQFAVNRSIEKVIETARNSAPTNVEKIGMAMVAGSTSSLFGCPAEYLMIQQQRTGKSLIEVFKSETSTYGLKTVYRGLVCAPRFCISMKISSPLDDCAHDCVQPATVSREALYASCYLGGFPILVKELQDVPGIKDIPGGPVLGAGITAGIIGTVTTHPSDTIKTRMQAFPDLKANPEYRTFFSTASHIVQEGGVQSLFAGLMPRAFRIIGAVFLFNAVKSKAVGYLDEKRSTSQ
jgi:hypothetical protein